MALEIQGNDNAITYKIGATARGQIKAFSVSESEAQEATTLGDGYNINTGVIALTSSTESGVMYFKNNESRNMIIESVFAGVGSSGTVTDAAHITIIRNPTGGTLISGAVNVDMITNRSHGTSNTLANSLAYKGAEGSTITGGDESYLFFQSAGGRLSAPGISVALAPGNSLAMKINTFTTAGTTNVYGAIACHLKAN